MYIKCHPDGKTNGLLSDLYFYSRNFSFACFRPPQPLLVPRCVNLCQRAISHSRSFCEKSPSSRLSRPSALPPSSLFCSQPRSLPLGLLRPLPFLTHSKTFCPTGLTCAHKSGSLHRVLLSAMLRIWEKSLLGTYVAGLVSSAPPEMGSRMGNG